MNTATIPQTLLVSIGGASPQETPLSELIARWNRRGIDGHAVYRDEAGEWKPLAAVLAPLGEKRYKIAAGPAGSGEFTIAEVAQQWRDNAIMKEARYLHTCGQWKPLAPLIQPIVDQQDRDAAERERRVLIPPVQARPIARKPAPAVASVPNAALVKTQRTRGIYVALGLFLGCLGIHNFYAGYIAHGLAQAIATAVAVAIFPPLVIVVAIWVIIELFAVTKDAAGDSLR